MARESSSSYRWVVLGLLLVALLVSYFDRSNLSIAAPYLAKELHLGPSQLGWVLGVFFVSYTAIQIPGGLLADRFGQRQWLIASIIWWSIFTFLTGAVAGFGLLIVYRFLFGIGEGLQPPSAWRTLSNWFATGQRSLASSLMLVSLTLGPAIVPILTVPVLAHLGWRWIFFLSAIPGLVVAVLLWLWIRDAPSGASETEEGSRGSAATTAGPAINATSYWKSRNLWLTFFAFFAFGFASYGLLTWLPSYLVTYRHFGLTRLTIFATLPYALGTLGMLLGGWLGDHLLRRHRRQHIAVAYLLTAAMMVVAATAPTAVLSAVALGIAGFFIYGAFGPFWTIPMDIVPAGTVGTYLGFVNMGPQIAGFLSPVIIGYLIGLVGTFTPGFIVMIVALVVAAGCILAVQLRQEGPDRISTAQAATTP